MNRQFWDQFLRSVETEPRQITSIVGKSGLTHELLGLGVDEARKRVVIISADPDARTAALAREDIQAKYIDQKIILARPLPFTLAPLATHFLDIFGSHTISLETIAEKAKDEENLQRLTSIIQPIGDQILNPIGSIPMNWVSVFQEAVSQLSLIKFQQPIGNESPEIHLSELLHYDVARLDRVYGNCPIPIYRLDENMHEQILSNGDDFLRHLLGDLEVFPYFFPEIEAIAIGLADRLTLNEAQLVKAIESSPDSGHPIKEDFLLRQFNEDPFSLIDNLKAKGYLVESETFLEISESGRTIRSNLVVKPQEGFISKLARLFSAKLDISWPPKI